MAINAISNVDSNNTNIISFGKRTEKPAAASHTTSPLKAVPLAVLIAMSPLNTTNASNIMRPESSQNVTELVDEPQVLSEKTVDTNQGKLKLSLYRKQFDGRDITYLRAIFTDEDGEKTAYAIDTKLDLSWSISGDDTKPVGEVTSTPFLLKHMNGGDDRFIENEEVEDFVNNAVKNYGLNLSIDKKSYLCMLDKDNGVTGYKATHINSLPGWLDRAKELKEDFGEGIATTYKKTDMGNYEISIYQRDDGSKVCTVRDLEGNGAELIVKGVKAAHYNLIFPDKQSAEVVIGQTVVERNQIGEKILMDPDLYGFLLAITDDPACKSALSVLPEDKCDLLLRYYK